MISAFRQTYYKYCMMQKINYTFFNFCTLSDFVPGRRHRSKPFFDTALICNTSSIYI